MWAEPCMKTVAAIDFENKEKAASGVIKLVKRCEADESLATACMRL